MNYLFLDNGFEEIEAITTIDLLRRAGIAVTTVSITGNPMVLGAHNIAVEADGLIERIDFSDAEMQFCLVDKPNSASVPLYVNCW